MNRSMRNAIALFTVAAVMAAPLAARADIDSPLVKQGLAAYASLDYARAISALEQARNESLTREEKIATYRTLGMAYVAVGQPGPASIDFQHCSASIRRSSSIAGGAQSARRASKRPRPQAATSAHAMAPALPSLSPSRSIRSRRARPPGHRARRLSRRRRAQDDGLFRKPGDAQFSRRVVAAAPTGTFDATMPGSSATAVARISRRAPRRSGAAMAARAASGSRYVTSASVHHAPSIRRLVLGRRRRRRRRRRAGAGLALDLPRSSSAASP